MFYKPKYCCNCSDKIERIQWKPWTSRRFCQLCETEFVSQEWIPRIIVAFGLIAVIVGVPGYFRKTEKPLKISESSLSRNASKAKEEPANNSSVVSLTANSNVPAPAQTPRGTPVEQQQKQRFPSSIQNAQPEQAENQLNSAKQFYFCGAATKKSTACSRRVKVGRRCWQHTGQPAILPPEKLIASR